MPTKSESKTIIERTAAHRTRQPLHPGEILWEEFLKPMGITQVAFAKRLGITLQRLNEVVRGRRGISAETALLIGQALGVSPEKRQSEPSAGARRGVEARGLVTAFFSQGNGNSGSSDYFLGEGPQPGRLFKA